MTYIPPRPNAPLPRFSLQEDEADPSDAAATAQRPALPAGRGRPILRRRRSPAGAREEVAPEDILLEAYLEEPSLPPRRRGRLPSSSVGPAAPPPPGREQAAVDAPLPAVPAPRPPRADDPSRVPSVARPWPSPPRAAPLPPTHETPSVAPVSVPSGMPVATSLPPPTQGGAAPSRWGAPPASAPSRVARRLVGSAVVLGLGMLIGGGAALSLPGATVARAQALGREVAGRWLPAAPRPPVALPPLAAAPLPVAPAPAASLPASPGSAPSLPSVPVDALPRPPTPAGQGLVTLPAHARGHRVYVDDVLLPTADSPVAVPCGRRTIQIGSAGRPRALDVPCGGEAALP